MTLYSAIMVWWLKHMNDKRNVACVLRATSANIAWDPLSNISNPALT